MHRKQLRIFPLALTGIGLALLASSADASRGRRVAIDTVPANWDGERAFDFATAPDGENWGPIALPGPASPPPGDPTAMVLKIGTKTYTHVWINKNGFITLGESAASAPVTFSSTVTQLDKVAGDVIAAFYSNIRVRQPELPDCNGSPGGHICDVTYATLDLYTTPPSNPVDPTDPIFGIRVTWGNFGGSDPAQPETLPGVVKESAVVDETKRVSFQIKLLDREQVTHQAGDFDLQLNYGGLGIPTAPSLTWEGSPSLVGVNAAGVLVDFAKFYTSFLDTTPDVSATEQANCLSGSNVVGDDPSFTRAKPLACNLITIEFRDGKPNLRTYTSNVSAALAGTATGTVHTTEASPLKLSVSNEGPDAATNVRATFDLPSAATLVSASPAGANCQQTAAKVNCTVASLASGASTDVTLTVKSTQAGSNAYTASVSADQYDLALAGNSAGTSVSLADSANLSITSCNRPASVTQGTSATVTCTVKNDGPQAAAQVVLDTTLPSQVTFSSGTNCSMVSGKLTCTSASIASGASADFSATLSTVSAGSAAISMSVRSDTFDPVTNNTADATFTVNAPANNGGGGGTGGGGTTTSSGGGGGGGAFTLPWLLLLALARVVPLRRRAR